MIEKVSIKESGMTFGPYPSDRFFHIEKSDIYLRLQEGVKMAEFLLLDTKCTKLMILEAKTKSPNSTSEGFVKFIDDVFQKMLNAFSLYFALRIERHISTVLPAPFKKLDLKQIKPKFILVIKEHKKEWCAPVSDALNKKFYITSRTWNLDPISVIVINQETAKKQNLIS